MCFNPGPERRVPSPNRYIADAKFCFCKNNKRIIIEGGCLALLRAKTVFQHQIRQKNRHGDLKRIVTVTSGTMTVLSLSVSKLIGKQKKPILFKVTEPLFPINCLVQSLSSTEVKRQGSTVVTGGTSRDFTTRIEGRRTSSFNEAGNRWRPSYIHNWRPPYNHNWRPSHTGSFGVARSQVRMERGRGWLRRRAETAATML